MIHFKVLQPSTLLCFTWLLTSHATASLLQSDLKQLGLPPARNRCELALWPKQLWHPAPVQISLINLDAPEFDPNSPQLLHDLMLPFVQDSLSEKAKKSEQSHRKQRSFGVNHNHPTARPKVSNDTHWVKHVVSDLSKMLPFNNDMNLGSNSDSDVYVELNAEKQWELTPKFSFHATQIFRYGSESRNYSETNFNFTQKESKTAFASTQFSVIKTYEETYIWDNHLFRQQQLSNDRRLTYGIYSNGIYDKTKRDLEVQSWGPYLSWRRPLWRNWVYIENEVSYYKDLTSDEGRHIFTTSLQFEANF